MLQPGDKVLVCLSGGKDSLSLLHALHQYQFYAASKGCHFTLGAVTVDPMTSSYDPSPLKAYLAALQLPYLYEEQSKWRLFVYLVEEHGAGVLNTQGAVRSCFTRPGFLW